MTGPGVAQRTAHGPEDGCWCEILYFYCHPDFIFARETDAVTSGAELFLKFPPFEYAMQNFSWMQKVQ